MDGRKVRTEEGHVREGDKKGRKRTREGLGEKERGTLRGNIWARDIIEVRGSNEGCQRRPCNLSIENMLLILNHIPPSPPFYLFISLPLAFRIFPLYLSIQLIHHLFLCFLVYCISWHEVSTLSFLFYLLFISC